MRGERDAPVESESAKAGSSPHARGTLHRNLPVIRRVRFIPACAGNAKGRLVSNTRLSVHPRMRGERRGRIDGGAAAFGSSPHARGTPGKNPTSENGDRFIPACAGNAVTTVRCRPSSPVHPRMRGERARHPHDAGCGPGSSPHARGTRFSIPAGFSSRRFIPACAGNAAIRPHRRAAPTVHPRMRGERHVTIPTCCGKAGSSPHARGTLLVCWGNFDDGRFIPACAGNAPLGWSSASLPAVHPRMRGERIGGSDTRNDKGGSSPHARGTPKLLLLAEPDRRFIPACAGNALPSLADMSGCAVHPRMRGERCNASARAGWSHGSSPHARGTRLLEPPYPRYWRFIPACAGNALILWASSTISMVHPRMRGERQLLLLFVQL
ncbi:hypothetical protein MIN45_P2355 [Methylomarinovum tepidoasis]|uniref:Uncharacterized protein n=1 Tax=Methylomarinovum tepidoasis TaxID=2840183 RepID=A0AAU9CDI2_9GAMM|nr:hypothetical protein MIN45_P2355 [Methylomarinovum sp. IN45]